MFGGFALGSRQRDHERQFGIRIMPDTTRSRTHVPASSSSCLTFTLRLGLLSSGSKRTEALSLPILRILHHLSPLRPVAKNGEFRYKKPRAVFEGLRRAIFALCATAEQRAERSGAVKPYASPHHFVGRLICCSGVLEPLLSIFLQPFATMLIAFYFALQPHLGLALHLI
jgi:hypothetical protein